MPNHHQHPQNPYELLRKKLQRLQKAHILETDPSVKFKLEHQINEIEAELTRLKSSSSVPSSSPSTTPPITEPTPAIDKPAPSQQPTTTPKSDILKWGFWLTGILLGYILVLLVGIPIFEQFAPNYTQTLVFVVLVIVSLVAAIVLFGFLESTGLFTTKWVEFGGAAALAGWMIWFGMDQLQPEVPVELPSMKISGLIFVDGKPASGVRVRLIETGTDTQTNEGSFSLKFTTANHLETYHLRLQYSEIDTTVEIRPSAMHALRIDLASPPKQISDEKPEPVTEPPVPKDIDLKSTLVNVIDHPVRIYVAGHTYETHTNREGKFHLQIPRPERPFRVEIFTGNTLFWSSPIYQPTTFTHLPTRIWKEKK
ncbi:MAG: hypothetical protein D6675_01640 [Gemmatimonadetes bacterium]|nr:MAG: hypothetical protein D6675_01640 [Gemmatimonadota bacterium]